MADESTGNTTSPQSPTANITSPQSPTAGTDRLQMTFEPQEDLIAVLHSSLNFSREAIIRGLYNTGNSDADRAATWILENMDDPDLNMPLATPLYLNESDSEDEFIASDNMYKMVFIVNHELGMGVGKIAAQVAHAALGLHRILIEAAQEALFLWEKLGETKIVLKGDNSVHLEELSVLASTLELSNYLVHDAGHTQVAAGSMTVLGIFGQVDQVNTVTGQLRLL